VVPLAGMHDQLRFPEPAADLDFDLHWLGTRDPQRLALLALGYHGSATLDPTTDVEQLTPRPVEVNEHVFRRSRDRHAAARTRRRSVRDFTAALWTRDQRHGPIIWRQQGSFKGARLHAG